MNTKTRQSRRDFIKSGSAATAGVALAGNLGICRLAHAAGSDVIKAGLIGCGGRGSGAAVNAMNAGRDVRIVALADIFRHRIDNCLSLLKKEKPDQVAVDDAHLFVGFDAYEKLIQSGVDVVLIAATSHFHPTILSWSVEFLHPT